MVIACEGGRDQCRSSRRNVRGACYADPMSEACTELDARLEAVASAAAPLPSRLPRVRDPALGRWMAHQMDALLRNVTSGYGALDVAIGEGLDALNVGRRAMDLSYSNIGDYAREELGINASTAVGCRRESAWSRWRSTSSRPGERS
jgi:hypothetical protein